MIPVTVISTTRAVYENLICLSFPKFKTLEKLTGQIRNRNEHSREVIRSKTEFIKKAASELYCKKLK